MQSHILGFPSIGRRRELKQALEAFWKGEISSASLLQTADMLKKRHWQIQKEAGLDYVVTGDFSFYDRMLDTTLMLGLIPERFAPCLTDEPMNIYFALARGEAKRNIAALEMTKWFDTNYHYLVPELAHNCCNIDFAHPVIADTRLAKNLGYNVKPAIIGPITWLYLAKEEGGNKWARLDSIILAYEKLLQILSPLCSIIQIEEPALCADLPKEASEAFTRVYAALNKASGDKLMLTSYFGSLGDNLPLAVKSGCSALHIDLQRGEDQLDEVIKVLDDKTKLSLGLIDGRNIWKSNYSKAAAFIKESSAKLGAERIFIATSCSLLHCPVDLEEEKAIADYVKKRMAFAVQKCDEVVSLGKIATAGDESALAENKKILEEALKHPESNVKAVRDRLNSVSPSDMTRNSPYEKRIKEQAWLNLPLLPTTTIGSFPQTAAIRKTRQDYKQGRISEAEYKDKIKAEIKFCIDKQEALGLDVFVHGEAERNDMVEYFGQQLGGFCFSDNGWVQSYGSRCVKPPIIYGDVYRKKPMTLEWISYAQSLTKKPLKGMLTGPVTILCWSFVRSDMPRSEVCRQIALAIRDEVKDLEKAGIGVIQIDEAALREGMPLRKKEAEEYLEWAVESFRLTACGVSDKTQIHTHMCYSEFNSILPWIAKMDADALSVESSRSRMELLDAFAKFRYPAGVGPGVYDIHSPRIPGVEEMVELLKRALKYIPKEQLWVNPDCGLKTRQWEEAYPSLENMVAAAKKVRESL